MTESPHITYRQGVIKDGGVVEGSEIPAPRPLWQPRKGHEKPGEDDLVPLDSRRRRRAQQRDRRGERRKMQARFVRRELAKEREANQLAQLFDLSAARVATSGPLVRHRANQAITARVVAIRKQDQARYDREWAAQQKNRSLPAPKPVLGYKRIWETLRDIAKAAPRVTPKVARRRQALDEFFAREMVGSREVTVGRTGRAG